MSRKPPRMVDVFGIGNAKRRKPVVAQDRATTPPAKPMLASCIGEPLRLWGEPIAMDARPRSDRLPVTFDGAVPTPENLKDPR